MNGKTAVWEQVARLAVATFDIPLPQPASEGRRRPDRRAGRRRRGGLADTLVDSAVERWLVAPMTRQRPGGGLPGETVLDRATVRRVVPQFDWHPHLGPVRAVVRFPVGVDTAAGSKTRAVWETLYAERFGATSEWQFTWPRGTATVVCSRVASRAAALPDLWPYVHDPARPWDDVHIGVGRSGEVSWNPVLDLHWLVGGASRAGKSAMVRAVQLQWLLAGGTQYAVDPKGVDFGWLTGRAGVVGVANPLADCVELLAAAAADLAARKRLFADAGAVEYPHLLRLCAEQGEVPPPPALVVVDEAAMVFPTRNAPPADRSLREHAQAFGAELAQQAAGFGMWAVIATQFPYAWVLEGWRGNLTSAAAVGRLRGPESTLVLGHDAARHLPKRRGDGAGPLRGRAVVQTDDAYETQIAWISKDDAADLADRHGFAGPPAATRPTPPPHARGAAAQLPETTVEVVNVERHQPPAAAAAAGGRGNVRRHW